ncbi:hypothetical protein N7509_013690 [Penicillium cosmopolitanum]|uniref:Zn(2)-C6 fungal-type domain-containing protein n=1 Tax=Penicillium cosmopolitanum TaxID=1131564 RepID=A0A9W9SGG5_9EURO|nr:uncharacterized protein N7509_013690 [Penicillium cosmopolitanum]KAJ5376804.1 hypothetical protein N7509_013690 [Penicillium cosmopolitanum]
MSTRSYQGCWTCKRRRRRCDNTRPTCQGCARRGVECEGYEVRLRWGSGIASRGRYTGADKPLEESVPPRPKGRQRDLIREKMRLEPQGQIPVKLDVMSPEFGEPVCLKTAREEEEEVIFNEFLKNGINVLHSTTARESMLQPRLPQLREESDALYTICLTFQLSLSNHHSSQFLEYFDTSLRKFRSELARSTSLLDGTLTAGLLLCSIGLMHGLPWTMHLEGMHNILQSHGLSDGASDSGTSTFRSHLLEVMGVMDLPCFSIGRQTHPSSIGRQSSCIGIWRRYCQSATPRRGVEPVSGLPRTLLDIFAGIGIDTTEQHFWDWAGEPGSFLQCYLWEAHRLAGILSLRRHLRSVRNKDDHEICDLSTRQEPNSCADATVLVTRIMANMDALRLACTERPTEDAFIKNAVLFPIFVAGLEITVLAENPQCQKAIRTCTFGSRQDEILLSLLEEMWRRNDPDLNVDDLARERGLEMGLL